MKFVILMIGLVAVFTACQNQTPQTVSTDGKPYYCPMHPEVTSDRPGVCPICHMDLVKRSSENALSDSLVVMLTDPQTVLANIRTMKVRKSTQVHRVKAYSVLDFAEPDRKIIAARFSGRIEKLYANQTGQYIKPGAPLFDIYSPALLEAQNDYLIALNQIMTIDSISGNNVLAASEQKLRFAGMTSDQVARLKASRQPAWVTTFHSPYGGYIIQKNAQEGAYIREGSALYEVADMSRLWSLAEIYENDIPYITVNMRTTLRLNAIPGKEFIGKVEYVYPALDAATRTIKVRSEFRNDHHFLRPQMYGEQTFETETGPALFIPETAIVFTGRGCVVWIKSGDHQFRPQTVKTGIKADSQYEITEGLREGDEIAITGGFLIDSESQLKEIQP